LERASQRNGAQNIPASAPSSVTVADPVPSRAVDTPKPYVGTNDEGPGGPDLNELKAERAQKTGAVTSHDETVSWGRSGGTEVTPERGAAVMPPVLEAFAGIYPEHIGVATEPNTFGAAPRPDVNLNRSWNAEQIFSGTKIGG
jgi:hypothetical protein